MKKIHIIAEAGTNHNGDAKTAQRLIDIAVNARANSVKFQIIYPDGLYLPEFYQNGTYIPNDVYKKRASRMLSDGTYQELKHYSDQKEIGFSASVFDTRGIDLLNGLDVPYIKISSCDLNNSYLLKKAADTGRKLIVSTGMSTLKETEKAIEDIYSTGHKDIVLMHCVSVYPCATANMNLTFIKTLKEKFGLPVGLSDHTENSIAAVIAVSMGAEWIEKHFTFDRKSEGFDHAYAMEPDEFKSYIHDIREAEKACTTPKDKLIDAEKDVLERARRGLYAARDLKAGDVLKEEDILIVRPKGLMEPNQLKVVMGQKLGQNIAKYQSLSPEHFQ